jgi:hypothetical protein
MIITDVTLLLFDVSVDANRGSVREIAHVYDRSLPQVRFHTEVSDWL